MLLTDGRTGAAAGRSGRGARLAMAQGYRWRLVAALAMSQTVGYGVLYYSFSVFLTPAAAALHVSTTTVTGAMTCSLLAGAAAGVPVGRWLDRHGGRALMSTGSMLATVLVVAWSRVTNVAELYSVWTALGVVSAAVLYEAAFPVVVSWFDADSRARALLSVTVVAGFASSIFLPLAGWLEEGYGWRTAIVILAAVHGAVTIPLHLLVRKCTGTASDSAPEPAQPAAAQDAAAQRRTVIRSALRDALFWVFAASFVIQACALGAIGVLLVAMLRALGHSPGFAATTAGALGVLSVTGRLATTAATRRLSTGSVTAAIFLVQAVGAATLPLAGHNAYGAIICVPRIRTRLRRRHDRAPGAARRTLRHHRVRHLVRGLGRTDDRRQGALPARGRPALARRRADRDAGRRRTLLRPRRRGTARCRALCQAHQRASIAGQRAAHSAP